MTKIDYHEENWAAMECKTAMIQYCVLMVAPGNGWRNEWKKPLEFYGTLEYFSGVFCSILFCKRL